MRIPWLLIGVGLGLVIGLGAGSQAHPQQQFNEHPLRMTRQRGPGYSGDDRATLYHLPDVGTCLALGWLGMGNGGPWAVTVPCPWEKNKSQ